MPEDRLRLARIVIAVMKEKHDLPSHFCLQATRRLKLRE
jgi:hypothetical protein